jgi:hypothetical protein
VWAAIGRGAEYDEILRGGHDVDSLDHSGDLDPGGSRYPVHPGSPGENTR